MSETLRIRVRELARQAIQQDRPTAWFERLYAESKGRADRVPWADLRPNPSLVGWLERTNWPVSDRRVAVVGCGLGDDAEALLALGARVSAFDISATAVKWCQERFPGSEVDYEVADLLSLPATWRAAFDLVVEIYTLQVLPAELRRAAQEGLASLLAPGGALFVLARGRDDDEAPGELPWPLTRTELQAFADMGLAPGEFDDFADPLEPGVRRFLSLWQRP